MPQSVKAVYENGVFRPLEKVNLTEHEEVEILLIQESEDLPAQEIMGLAQRSQSFSFLKNPGEDIYTLTDGEPVYY